MFWFFQRPVSKDRRSDHRPSPPTAGASRRTINAIPPALDDSTHQVSLTSGVRLHQMLVSIEANGMTGCLKVISRVNRARGAILLYYGRVVSCVYRRKSMEGDVFEHAAFRHVMNELATAGNLLDGYALPESVVLTQAGLFNRIAVVDELDGPAVGSYLSAASRFDSTMETGSIAIITATGQVLSTTYMAGKSIAGIYAEGAGWLPRSHGHPLSLLQNSPGASIRVASLAASESARICQRSMSLTGILCSYGRAHFIKGA